MISSRFFVQPGGVTVKLGLCGSGRFRLESTTSESGNWLVRVVGGVATLVFADDDQQPFPQQFHPALDSDGGVTVEGSAPLDDTGLVDAACQS